ncbi:MULTISPECIES: hypothetical protein [Planktothrix]|uniref:hypothetical protein n=1 Tax=Planktothrix TaxID=54304 RepID=UPI0004187565|nr:MULTISPECIES: hypothetical protein [Planktothrix]CAD0231882.1 conserved hypothetical protein [Planktothrix agardhii]
MIVELQFRTLLNGQTFGTGTFSYNGQYAPVTILHQGDLISFTYQDEIVGSLDLSHLANFDFVYQSVDNICAFNIVVASADRTRSLTAGPAQPHLTRPGTSADVAKPRSQVVELEWPTPKTSPLTPPPTPVPTEIPTPPPTPVPTEIPTPPPIELYGEFDVVSTSETGYNFTNISGWDMTFTFTPSGEWKPAYFLPYYNAAGSPGFPYQQYMVYPQQTSFALLAIDLQTNTVLAEVTGPTQLEIKPGQTIAFRINDVVGCYTDNYGTLTVQWVIGSLNQYPCGR